MINYTVVEKQEGSSTPHTVTVFGTLDDAAHYAAIRHNDRLDGGTIEVKKNGEIVLTFSGTQHLYPVYTVSRAARKDYEADPKNCQWEAKAGYDTWSEAVDGIYELKEAAEEEGIYKIDLEAVYY